VKATATDTAGNTTSTSVTVTVDNAPPAVSLTAPASNAFVAGSITVSATASDNVSVSGVQFFVDGTAVGSQVTTSPYSVTWNTSGASNGTHTLKATATDEAGNTTST